MSAGYHSNRRPSPILVSQLSRHANATTSILHHFTRHHISYDTAHGALSRFIIFMSSGLEALAVISSTALNGLLPIFPISTNICLSHGFKSSGAAIMAPKCISPAGGVSLFRPERANTGSTTPYIIISLFIVIFIAWRQLGIILARRCLI